MPHATRQACRPVLAPARLRHWCRGQAALPGLEQIPTLAAPVDTPPAPAPTSRPAPKRQPRTPCPRRTTPPPVAPQHAVARPGTPRPPRPDLELPRHWTVNFEVLDGVNSGKVKLSSPQARGWAAVIRPNPTAVIEAITAARIHVAEQGHAAWRGTRTELDLLTEHDDPTEPAPPRVADVADIAARADRRFVPSYSQESQVGRPDQASIAAWQPLPPNADGSVGGWLSPGGRTCRAPYKGVLEKRRVAGLPTSWEEQVAAQSGRSRPRVVPDLPPEVVGSSRLVDVDAVVAARAAG